MVSGHRNLTIVTHHFVRDLARSRYPAIKGLDLAVFREQLDYIRKTYTPVTVQDTVGALRDRTVQLPPNPVLLTFDDGYLDHYTNVFPLLEEFGIQGAFFPPVGAVMEDRVLRVNKIHFLLASMSDPEEVSARMLELVHRYRGSHELPNDDEYRRRYAVADRFDLAEVIFIKRLLQKGLPEPVAESVSATLFAEYVTADEAAFSAELYMSQPQLKTMIRAGMFVGSHGRNHRWLDTLDPDEQASEVDASLEFLRSLGAETNDWVMCYPYGGYDQALLKLLRDRSCAMGLSVELGRADLDTVDPLVVPRIDTNDILKALPAGA